jgi:hypothetical protein
MHARTHARTRPRVRTAPHLPQLPRNIGTSEIHLCTSLNAAVIELVLPNSLIGAGLTRRVVPREWIKRFSTNPVPRITCMHSNMIHPDHYLRHSTQVLVLDHLQRKDSPTWYRLSISPASLSVPFQCLPLNASANARSFTAKKGFSNASPIIDIA